VKKAAPGAEYRIVSDHYIGKNGITHVHFKQTAFGLDIDNADFNVNVSTTRLPGTPKQDADHTLSIDCP
jgi:extracellular elastinolytic metalloproteinase